MQLFVGLDVSQVLTHLCVVDPGGRQVWRSKRSTAPDVLAQTIETYGKRPARLSITHISWSSDFGADFDIGQSREPAPDDGVAWRWVV